jgi:hypothetical protein
MCQLLGSTNKAEVLESMEFFRIAWEYQFDSAEVRLHLVFQHTYIITSLPAHSSESRKCYT